TRRASSTRARRSPACPPRSRSVSAAGEELAHSLGEHHVALDAQLAAHVQGRALGLAGHEGDERVLVGRERDGRVVGLTLLPGERAVLDRDRVRLLLLAVLDQPLDLRVDAARAIRL